MDFRISELTFRVLFFRSFVDIKRLSCIRNGITSVCFALSSRKENWLVYVNRCKSCRSLRWKVWWTLVRVNAAGIMFSRQFFEQFAPIGLQFMVLFKSFPFQRMVNIKRGFKTLHISVTKLAWDLIVKPE